MARGNQRELARQKNMKKSQEISKGKRKDDSLTTSQRKQRSHGPSTPGSLLIDHTIRHVEFSQRQKGLRKCSEDSEIMQQKQKAANEKKSMQTREK